MEVYMTLYPNHMNRVTYDKCIRYVTSIRGTYRKLQRVKARNYDTKYATKLSDFRKIKPVRSKKLCKHTNANRRSLRYNKNPTYIRRLRDLHDDLLNKNKVYKLREITDNMNNWSLVNLGISNKKRGDDEYNISLRLVYALVRKSDLEDEKDIEYKLERKKRAKKLKKSSNIQ